MTMSATVTKCPNQSLTNSSVVAERLLHVTEYLLSHLRSFERIWNDTGRKSQFFHTPPAVDTPLRMSSSEYGYNFWYAKTRMVWLPMVKEVWGCLFNLTQYTNLTDTGQTVQCLYSNSSNSSAYTDNARQKNNLKHPSMPQSFSIKARIQMIQKYKQLLNILMSVRTTVQ